MCRTLLEKILGPRRNIVKVFNFLEQGHRLSNIITRPINQKAGKQNKKKFKSNKTLLEQEFPSGPGGSRLRGWRVSRQMSRARQPAD